MDEKYIDFNTEKRMNGANGFEKEFFNFMVNSVCGKTMENLRKRVNVTLINNAEDFLKYTSKPLPIRVLVKIILLFMKLNQF